MEYRRIFFRIVFLGSLLCVMCALLANVPVPPPLPPEKITVPKITVTPPAYERKEKYNRLIMINDLYGSDTLFERGILAWELIQVFIQEAAPVLVSRALLIRYLDKLLDFYDDFPQLHGVITKYKEELKSKGVTDPFEQEIKALTIKDKNEPYISYVSAQVPLNEQRWYFFDYSETEYVLFIPRIFEKKL